MRRLPYILTALPLLMLLLAMTPVRGTGSVGAETMHAFVAQHNAAFDTAIPRAFESIAAIYGIRHDVAMCQAILETGWFRYEGGTAVTPEMHNYCGLGVTRLGLPGERFASVDSGVEAMMQHLYAYATTDTLPAGRQLIDPRFHKVTRGSAPTWERLSGRWAANARYGQHILQLYADMLAFADSAAVAPVDSTPRGRVIRAFGGTRRARRQGRE